MVIVKLKGVVEFDKLDPRLVYRVLSELMTPKAPNSLSGINGLTREKYVRTLWFHDLIKSTGYKQIREVPKEWLEDESLDPGIIVETSKFAHYYQTTSKGQQYLRLYEQLIELGGASKQKTQP